jgi:hypothetical protein
VTVRSGTALARLLRQAAPSRDVEQCELCGGALEDEHRHLLDLHDDQLRCACRGCALLFERDAAARGNYRLVPQRRERLDAGATAAKEVDAGVPVGLAFFVLQPDHSALVRYPSPIGSTTGTVDPATWAGFVSRWPQLADLEPSVEALLVHTARGRHEYWIVPIEDCYRLVAVIRDHWTGMSGGTAVWPAVDDFFAGLSAPTRGRITLTTS